MTLSWRGMDSNFQYAGSAALVELAVAAAIAVFGLESGVLATVVGVLVEVPVMLSVVRTVLRTRGWYQAWRWDIGRVRTRRRHRCQCRRDSARGSLALATKRGRKADCAGNGGWISEPRSAVLSGVPDRTPRSEIFHASGLWGRAFPVRSVVTRLESGRWLRLSAKAAPRAWPGCIGVMICQKTNAGCALSPVISVGDRSADGRDRRAITGRPATHRTTAEAKQGLRDRRPVIRTMLEKLVGARGFEPPTRLRG